MKREVVRKLIHLSTLVVPLLVWVLPRAAGLSILVAAVLAALAIEVGRLRIRRIRYLFLRYTRPLLRGHERRGLAGATYLAIAYLIALLVFPKPIAVLAMLYGGAGDAVAALVGRRWGRHRTSWGKSWEGAGAAFALTALLGVVMPGISTGPALIGALAASAFEFLPLPVDDNLLVSLGGGAVLWLAMILI